MRRPAPLPAAADEPARSTRERRVARRAGTDAPESDALDAVGSGAAVASDAAVPSMWDSSAGSPEADSITAAIDDADLPASAVRTSEVWRAARARRKALRAEIRRFTQRSRRRRIILWGSVGAIAALILGSVIAAYSPLFAVREITVAGASRVDTAAVQQALQSQIGKPLALVDASGVKSALTEFPMIETYALEARPPHELLVRIVERTPIGVIGSDAGYSLVDAAGVVLSTTPQPPEGSPLLDIAGGIDSPAFRSAGLVMRSLPADFRTGVTEVRATSADDVTLKLADGKTVVWGSESDSVRKAAVLVRLIATSPGSTTFDVSSPTVPVVR
ncbi:FtsQ-type POTRA domain-containing protein [Microbacterium alcoholitolerans]|uniref:FtsQ-type POTRA domain-containing protein n=1 Tax=unclassified Microbacterium TaxID=2609290 RepID=UPI003D163B25